MSLVGPVLGKVNSPAKAVFADQQSGARRAVIVDFDYHHLTGKVPAVELEIEPSIMLGETARCIAYLQAAHGHSGKVQPHGADSGLTDPEMHPGPSRNNVAVISEVNSDFVVNYVDVGLPSILVGIEGWGQKIGDRRKQR